MSGHSICLGLKNYLRLRMYTGKIRRISHKNIVNILGEIMTSFVRSDSIWRWRQPNPSIIRSNPQYILIITFEVLRHKYAWKHLQNGWYQRVNMSPEKVFSYAVNEHVNIPTENTYLKDSDSPWFNHQQKCDLNCSKIYQQKSSLKINKLKNRKWNP